MLERTYVITKEVLEKITFALSYPTVTLSLPSLSSTKLPFFCVVLLDKVWLLCLCYTFCCIFRIFLVNGAILEKLPFEISVLILSINVTHSRKNSQRSWTYLYCRVKRLLPWSDFNHLNFLGRIYSKPSIQTFMKSCSVGGRKDQYIWRIKWSLLGNSIKLLENRSRCSPQCPSAR
jgi:hypothetical protein